jgi:hypothetical protein
MAVGVVLGGRRLQGSCGGTGADCLCDREGRPRPPECRSRHDGSSDAPPVAPAGPVARGRHPAGSALRVHDA